MKTPAISQKTFCMPRNNPATENVGSGLAQTKIAAGSGSQPPPVRILRFPQILRQGDLVPEIILVLTSFDFSQYAHSLKQRELNVVNFNRPGLGLLESGSFSPE